MEIFTLYCYYFILFIHVFLSVQPMIDEVRTTDSPIGRLYITRHLQAIHITEGLCVQFSC